MKHILLLTAVAFLSFSLVGCTSTSTIVFALSAVGDACAVSSVVVPVLEATGVINAAVGTVILTYTDQVAQAVPKAKAELESSDPNPLKIAKIAGYFTGIAAPALPGRAGAVVMAIQVAVEMFLERLQKPSVVAYAAAMPGQELKLSYADKSELGNISKKAAATSTTIAKWKAAHPVK